MDLMSIAQLLGNVGEFFGSIAVLVTLAYLTIQVRQNSNSINSSNYFNAATSYNTINALSISDDETSRLMIKGTNTPEQLTEDESARYFLLLRAYNNNFMAVWWSHQNGTFPDEQFRVYERNFIQLVASPGGRTLLPTLSYDYPEYADYLEKRAAERGNTRWFRDRGYDTVD
ncbi:MAG: hypothetical protein P8X82_14690 [Gemmatimonadales bacterium]